MFFEFLICPMPLPRFAASGGCSRHGGFVDPGVGGRSSLAIQNARFVNSFKLKLIIGVALADGQPRDSSDDPMPPSAKKQPGPGTALPGSWRGARA